MKRKFFSLAFALICTSSVHAAQSNVTLYGLVDMGIGSTHVSGPDGIRQSSTGVLSGGLTDSLFGLKGNERLSDDLSAVFQLEAMFNGATGSLSDQDRFFNSNAWVGLASERFGELRLGRQHTVAQQFGSRLEVASWKEMGLGSTFRASDNYQVNNAVNYLSPSWSGFTMGVGYSFDVTGEQVNGRNSPAISAALQYEHGPLLFVASWDKAYLSETVFPDRAQNPEAWQLGMSYDFGLARVSMGWSRQNNGYAGLNGGDPDNLGLGLGVAEFANGGRLNAYMLGAAVPVSAKGTVLLQYSLVKPDWEWQDGERASTGHVATLGYVYGLSPRTNLYAMAGIAKRYSLDDQVVQGQGTTTRYIAGVSHSF